jgi:hypothetical protein
MRRHTGNDLKLMALKLRKLRLHKQTPRAAARRNSLANQLGRPTRKDSPPACPKRAQNLGMIGKNGRGHVSTGPRPIPGMPRRCRLPREWPGDPAGTGPVPAPRIGQANDAAHSAPAMLTQPQGNHKDRDASCISGGKVRAGRLACVGRETAGAGAAGGAARQFVLLVRETRNG